MGGMDINMNVRTMVRLRDVKKTTVMPRVEREVREEKQEFFREVPTMVHQHGLES